MLREAVLPFLGAVLVVLLDPESRAVNTVRELLVRDKLVEERFILTLQ